MEKLWEGLHTPHKVKSGVSGCPRNCAEATVKDIGCVAVEGGWQVRAGGAAGGNVREADILATVADARRGAAGRDDVPAVLPRERRLQGAHVRLHPAHRAREGARGRARRGVRRRAARAPADRQGGRQGPLARARRPYHPRQFDDLDTPDGRRRRARARRTAGRRMSDELTPAASTTCRSARAARSRSTAAGSRSSARPPAGTRSTPPARTAAGRSPTGSSATARSSARCTTAATTSQSGAPLSAGDGVAAHAVELRGRTRVRRARRRAAAGRARRVDARSCASNCLLWERAAEVSSSRVGGAALLCSVGARPGRHQARDEG